LIICSPRNYLYEYYLLHIMSPLPENIQPAATIDEAMALYRTTAKSHNELLAHYLILKEQYEGLTRQIFGTRSEKLHFKNQSKQEAAAGNGETEKNKGQDLSSSAASSKAARTIREPKKTNPSKGHGWGPLPAHLKREEIIVPFTPDQLAVMEASKAVHMRDEVSERLCIRPPVFYVKRYIRPVVSIVDRDGIRTVVTAPFPELKVEKGRMDLSVLIYIAVAKFVDHTPIDRLRKIFARQEMKVSTSTMGDSVECLHDCLVPIYDAMADSVRRCALVHTDDTVVRVVRKDKPHKTHKGRMWVYIGAGHSVYEYSPTRAGVNPSRFLSGFAGKLQADGYAGYNAVANQGSVVRVGCHAHARRYFEKALQHFPDVLDVLNWYQELFEIERQATNQNASLLRRRRLRQAYSRPVLDKIKDWMDAKKVSGIVPKSTLGEAIGYALGQWSTLLEFLKDGNLPLSNNISERAMRCVVMGRVNYLFFGSETAAQRGAVMYSVLHSCICLGINPEEYLQDIIPRMNTVKAKDVYELTPVGWLAERKIREQAQVVEMV
jgi:transposase